MRTGLLNMPNALFQNHLYCFHACAPSGVESKKVMGGRVVGAVCNVISRHSRMV